MADSFSKQLTLVTALIAGFKAGMPGGAATFLVNNKSYAQADILATLGAIQAILAAVPGTELAYKAALQARDEAEPETLSMLNNVSTALRGALGTSPTGLAPYGLKARKARTALTTEQKVAMAAKSAATRKARGTLGKKQRAAIKGVVPAAPAAPPAPATPTATPKGP